MTDSDVVAVPAPRWFPAQENWNLHEALKSPGQFIRHQILRRPRLLHPAPIIIIGMHRSGTSALGGVLQPLGLTVGKSIMPPSEEGGNPIGFYENMALMRLHDRFLNSVGADWMHCGPWSRKQFRSSSAREFSRELVQVLIEEFGLERALIKDPRMCRLLPLWIPIIKSHFPHAQFLLPIRHPLEVAFSLRKRDNLSLNHALKLWVLHVLEGEKYTRGFQRVFTTYDKLIQAPYETVLPLARSLGLSSESIEASISTRLDANLRHHRGVEWPAEEPHKELTLAIYETLVTAGAGMEGKLNALGREYYRELGWH